MAKKTVKRKVEREVERDNKRSARPAQGRRARRERSEKEVENSPSTTVADNDPSWYAANEYLLRDAASIPYSTPLGVQVHWPLKRSTIFGDSLRMRVPTVLNIEMALLPGNAKVPGDAVNTAAFNVYSFVRHANSGHSNYDAANLMMYILAMDNIYAVYSHLARLYGLIRLYSERNRGLPRHLFYAMGYNYTSFADNMVDFRFWLNTLAQKVGSFCVPASMTYTMRHMWLFQNVFADGPGFKSQLYTYSPECILQYIETNGQPPTLKRRKLGRLAARNGASVSYNMMTFQMVKDIVDSCINNIVASEDLAIMSGDILKAFGPDKVWKLMPIHEDLVVLPVYSEEVLGQIHNAYCMPFPMTTKVLQEATLVPDGSWQLTQSTDGVVKEVVDTQLAESWLEVDLTKLAMDPAAVSFASAGVLLDIHKDDVSAGDTMVCTRLMPSVNEDGVLDEFGSELVTGFYMVAPTSGQTYEMFTWYGFNSTPYIPAGTLVSEDMMELTAQAAKFGMHPHFHWVERSSNNVLTHRGSIIDIDNYTFVDPEVLKRMHQTALLSEFSVPLMGAWNTKI